MIRNISYWHYNFYTNEYVGFKLFNKINFISKMSYYFLSLTIFTWYVNINNGILISNMFISS